MIHLRVHAGPHDRRHCPVSVDLDLDACARLTLYQEPKRRPRYVQLELLGDGSRLTWMVERLDAGQTLDYRLVHSPKRRPPSPRVRWQELAGEQLQATLDGESLAVWKFAPSDFPRLVGLRAPGGAEDLLEAVWFQADLTPRPHSRSVLVERQEPTPGPVFGRLTYGCHWLGPAQERLGEELTRFTVFATPAQLRLVDLETQLQATTGPIHFAKSGETGLLRLKLGKALREMAARRLTTSAGAVGAEEVARLPGEWCAILGPVSLAVAGHPDSPGGGAGWRLDADGILRASPFAAIERFAPLLDDTSLHIATGESLVLRYRLVVLAGNPRLGAVRQHCLNFAFPPRVEVL